MLDNLATFPHARGRRVLPVAMIGAAIAPKQTIHEAIAKVGA
jgi:hypothetical protein